ncbi:type II CRISPR RNA-guided endonuclease Cas9 [Paracoccus versutus]|uniref:CRISPR-associated endonuclease Cas9 n=2 Tax=Paracoccus versutus TaxID=34007 RepID=A0A3D9XNK2_PARVE|nr:type II CRISPR RNA-guided endonuclease Cas9 [Paracoccus versutus]REF69742.1 CRISPR-associated Csn1 family endonuclease [Paracoccus versutus]WGR57895.1 type II CRISPR RNA-guided endonuclease Cas9 [Paracoccus versutus]
MTTTLGIDLGTSSLGWCLIEDEHRILDLGVIIFSAAAGAGRDPQSGAPLAEARREARSARRRRDRFIGRRSALLDKLIALGLLPGDPPAGHGRRRNQALPNAETKALADTDPHVLRRRALSEPLSPHEIGRAIFHLNTRRGFKSNRKADRGRNEPETGKIATAGQALDAALGKRTLGQFLADRIDAGQPARVRMGGENQAYDFYPQRSHLEAEFAAIWEAQEHHHPELLTDTARTAIHRILFFQRPLKTPEVGFCTFAGMSGVPHDERRLPKAHPLFQERRLYEEVNNLKVVAAGAAARDLTLDERDRLILKLRDNKKVTFATLAKKVLKLAEGERFNKESEARKDLAGDEVRAEMADKKRFGNRWTHFPLERQLQIIDRVQNEENPDILLAWLQSDCGLDKAAAVAVARTNLPEGHGRFGETATRRLIAALKAEVVTYDKAALAAGFHHSDHRTGEVYDLLPYYGEVLTREIAPGKAEYGDPLERQYGKVTNPTVHIGLRQLQKLVNAVIARHGRPDRIVIELARELKLNDKQKDEHQRRIRRDTEAAIRRGEKLVEAGIADTGANRALMRQWEELNPSNPLDRRCPYCGEPIGMAQIFNSLADIDHIIPYSRSLDDSPANKVLVHRNCNRQKGNKTPWDRWHEDEAKWEIISAQVARMHPSKQWRFGPDAMERLERDGGFAARQLTDTQYLARIADKYLRGLYPTADEGRVDVIPGRMTAMLRRVWGLNSLLPDHNFVENEHSSAPKNRLDHRHHAIDATVAAVTSLSRMQQIAAAAARSEEKELERLFDDLPHPWDGFREDLGACLARTVATHKPDHGRSAKPSRHRDVTAGKLHNDTAYGLTGLKTTDGKTPIVVHRVLLASLKPTQIADPDCIPDETLRNALWLATRDCSGKAFDQALARFAKEHPVFKGIRRVRIREPLNVIPIHDREGKPYKSYAGASNDRYNVWRMPDASWRHDVVSTFNAHRSDYRDLRPHPAAKKVLSLRQNDMIAVERNGGLREIMRVVKFNQAGRLTLCPPNEGGKLQNRDAAPNDADPFKYTYLSPSSLKNAKARQVRIDPLGRVFDPGPRE